MSDGPVPTLDELVAAASGNVSQQPLARRQVLPWADLQALNQPTDLNQLANALVSTLAVLVAQGKDRPRLLSADAQGRLITSAAGNSLARFAAAFTGGNTLAMVDDSSGFFPGQIVAFASASGSGAACGGMTVESIPDSTHIQVFSSCVGQNFVVGDFVVGRNTTSLDNTGVTFDVADRAARLLGHVNVDNFPAEADLFTSQSVGIYGKTASGVQHVTSSVDNVGQVHLNVRATLDPPTSFGGFTFGNPATPSVTIPAISGLSVDLLYFEFIANNVSGAGAYSTNVTVASTGAGAANLWLGHLATPNVQGSTDTMPKNPYRVVTQPGQGISLVCGVAVPAGYGVDINVAYTYK